MTKRKPARLLPGLPGAKYGRMTYPTYMLGTSLVEIMIALTIGLLLLAGMATVFVQSSGSQREMEQSSQQIENGRYALKILRESLWQAGYYGEVPAELAAPSSVPNPCLALASWDSAYKSVILQVPVQGYDSNCSALLSSRVANTGVLVVRHASATTETCVSASCGTATKMYIQPSKCSADASLYAIDLGGFSNFNLQKRATGDVGAACTGGKANLREMLVYLYYIGTSNGVPTLMRRKLGDAASEPVVEGIENLQVRFGVDTSSPSDGTPDTWTDCATCTATQWSNVVAVKLYVLARNLKSTAGFADAKTYDLGNMTFTPTSTAVAFKRHLFTETVAVMNSAGRREQP